MISKAASKYHLGVEPGFQWRGNEPARIEGLSDAVFAFAVTLLVVSLEVPRSYAEFYHTLAGLPSFAMTFLLLMFIWYEQYRFFRRYGLQDGRTVILSLALLFVVLYYIYPLKFLFNGIFAPYVHAMFPSIEGLPLDVFTTGGHDVGNLMVLYNIGVAAVWLILYMLYSGAYKLREPLRLNEVELHDTRWSMYNCLFFVALGVIGTAMAITDDNIMTALSGMMYGPACGVYFSVTGWVAGKKRLKLLAPSKAH